MDELENAEPVGAEELVFRRKADRQLLAFLTNYHKELTMLRQDMLEFQKRTDEKIMDMLHVQQNILDKISTILVPAIESHQVILCGKPESLGKDGLIATVNSSINSIDDMKKELKHRQTIIGMILSAIIFLATLLYNFVKDFFAGGGPKP